MLPWERRGLSQSPLTGAEAGGEAHAGVGGVRHELHEHLGGGGELRGREVRPAEATHRRAVPGIARVEDLKYILNF